MKKPSWQMFGLVLSVACILLFCLGYIFAQHSPVEIHIGEKFAPSSWNHPFGKDHLGRCEFARIMEGGETTLSIVFLGSLMVFVIGGGLGLLTSMVSPRGRLWVDGLLNAVTALPSIVYVIIFVGIWGNSIPTMLFALTITMNLRLIKLVKSLALVEMGKAYILCQIASGASKWRILWIHILPNIIFPMVKFLCLSCSEMIITISGFSFIGLSLGDDVIDWGSMLSDARSYISMKPSLLLYPILCIFISSICFNYIGQKVGEKQWLR